MKINYPDNWWNTLLNFFSKHCPNIHKVNIAYRDKINTHTHTHTHTKMSTVKINAS